jgi:DNA-directed RNA polymerase subunit omega
MVPPQVSSVARKPLSIAFEEIAADKIVKIERLPYDEMEAEADEIFGADVAEDDAAESDAE